MAIVTSGKVKAPQDGDTLLVEARKVHPGVAELMRLYDQHAETMRRASPYVVTRPNVVIIASGDTTA